MKRVRVAALILSCVGLALAASAMPLAAQSVVAQAETPSAALARHMRVLATKPKDFYALIGAGKAALELGDTQSAAGFFGRAEEAWPASPMPQIGMGAALAHEGDPAAALQYFARAEQLGAKQLSFGVDRGLALDLLGRHSEAQADYRAALSGVESDEARRRLALSLAITGQREEAVAILAPLMARGDSAAARCRALALALSGDPEGARRMLDMRMPGSGAQMAPFLAKLPALRSDQKAAAVHLGIFPDSGQAYAVASLPPYVPPSASPPAQQRIATTPGPSAERTYDIASAPSQDRLLSIEQLIKSPAQSDSVPVQIANVQPAIRQPITSASPPSSATTARSRIWLQLASGSNSEALPSQFRRLKSRHRDLFEGISAYVAEDSERSRLLIGPFKSASDAETFAQDLASVSVDAFSWVSRPGQAIRKLPNE